MMFAGFDKVRTMAVPVLGMSVILAGLSGCALRPARDTFDLSPMSATAVNAPAASVLRTQILVPTPSAIQTLGSRNIIVRLGGAEVRYLNGAQWSDQLPAVIQAQLAAALENTGHFAGVGMPGQGLAIDYQLVVEVREFAIDATGSGKADVELSVKLLNDRTGVVRAQRLFTASVPVSPSASNGTMVSALDSAFADVQQQVVTWVVGIL